MKVFTAIFIPLNLVLVILVSKAGAPYLAGFNAVCACWLAYLLGGER